MSKGIDGLKVLVKFATEAGEALESGITGGSIIDILGGAVKLSDDVIAVSKLDKDELKLEYADLDAAERDELVKFFSEEFDLQDDYAELLVERSLDALVKDGLVLVKKLLAIKAILKDGKKAAPEPMKKPKKKKESAE